MCVERLRQDGFGYHHARPDYAHLSGKGCKLRVMPVDSEGWTEMLVFRDYLRQHPETMEAYHRLKQDLAREHGRNGQRYVDGKRAFVLAVVEQARQEAGHTQAEHEPSDG